MDAVFNAVLDRTRSRLDVPTLRTLFGIRQRPGRNGTDDLSLRQAVVIETPAHDLTIFKVHFGLLTVKGYTKGERVLRFEAIVHNTKTLRTGRALERFPQIVTALAQTAERFCTLLDCVDVGFIPDTTLDELPLPSQIGATRVGGIDLNKQRTRAVLTAVLAAVLALSVQPGGFTTADLAAKVTAIRGQAGYTVRQAAYDLRKLRGKHLVDKPGRTRRHHVPPTAARTIAALTVLRDQVITPLLAGITEPRLRKRPATWTDIDQHYQTLRLDMMVLFADLGIACG